jgi:hypothetical protein
VNPAIFQDYPSFSRAVVRTNKGGAMLLKTNANCAQIYPQLSRVWIRTGDPRMPLKSVWINEAKLHHLATEAGRANRESETAGVSEDNLSLAA